MPSDQTLPSRPTLRQVAALSGVSLKTASRVMNGEQYVAEATAAKVQAAAAQLGFRRNTIARELRSGARSSSVGLIIGDLANPFYSRIARGAERRLRADNRSEERRVGKEGRSRGAPYRIKINTR